PCSGSATAPPKAAPASTTRTTTSTTPCRSAASCLARLAERFLAGRRSHSILPPNGRCGASESALFYLAMWSEGGVRVMGCGRRPKLWQVLVRLRAIAPEVLSVRVVAGGACAVLLGCQAVTSEPFSDKAAVGVPYSLPTALAILQFSKDDKGAVTVETAT